MHLKSDCLQCLQNVTNQAVSLKGHDPTHEMDFNNCAILGFSNHWQKRLTKESLYIQKINPSMTIDKQSISLCLFIT